MGSNCTNESEIWVKIKKGDKNALSDLYGMYADALYEFGRFYTSDGHLIEDGIHDLFIDIYERRKKLPVARNVKNYLFTILRRKITEASRNRSTVIFSKEDNNNSINRDQEGSVETNIIHEEENEKLGLLLSNAINKLTPQQKKGVSMRFYENKSYEEMAFNLDISVETARTLIYRSVQRLKKNFS